MSAELINVSENATFLVSDPDAGPSVLRVHRLGYHTEREIVSELAWMDALRAEAGVRTPRVLPAADGRRVVTVGQDATSRYCVRFEFLPGTEPGGQHGDRLTGRHFEELGEITARMHRHARMWPRPSWFARVSLGLAGRIRGAGPVGTLAGRYRRRPGRARGARPPPRPAPPPAGRVRQRPERYGLVHADTRPANLIVHGGSVAVIDFDDCGFSWYLYDLAAALSFFEHSPDVPGLVDSWLTGYRRGGQLPAETRPKIWTFILFRRLLLVAWLGSHRAVDVAAELARDTPVTAATCQGHRGAGAVPAASHVTGVSNLHVAADGHIAYASVQFDVRGAAFPKARRPR